MKTNPLKTNHQKKMLSMLLALTMIFQMSVSAVFAEGEENQKRIIAFEELAEDVKNITVEVESTEAEAKAKMPTVVNAVYAESTTGTAINFTIENINWEIDEANSDSNTFDSSQSGAIYTYKAKLPATDSQGDELVPQSGVALPAITVRVGTATPIMRLTGGANPVTELWMGATKVISNGTVFTTSGAGWSYDSTTSTLTLNGVNITIAAPKDEIDYDGKWDLSANHYGLFCRGDLDIVINGNNTIDMRDFDATRSVGAYIKGNSTVSGNGKLTLGGRISGLYFHGDLRVQDDVELEGIFAKETEYISSPGNGMTITGSATVTDRAHLIGRANNGGRNTGINLYYGQMTIGNEAMVSAFAKFGNGGNTKGIDAINAEIRVNGKLVVESGDAGDKTYGSGIHLNNSNLTAEGTGSVEAKAGNHGPTSGYGVYGVITFNGGSITIDGGGFLASGGSGAVHPFDTPVTINEAPVYYEISPNRDGSNPTIYTSAEEWADVNGKFENIKYIKATTIYDVYVNGVQVTRLNSHDVLGDSKVSYSTASGSNPAALRLNNASFDGDIKLSESTNMILTGANTIRDIHTHGAVILGGSGELTLNGSLEGTEIKLEIEESVKLNVSSDVTVKELINRGSIVNNASIKITDSFGGSGAILNDGRIAFPSQTEENYVKTITGDGISEIVNDEGAPSAFYSQGRRLFLVEGSLDFTQEPAPGGYKADATLETDGYSFNGIDKVLALGDVFIRVSGEHGVILPSEASVRLQGISHINTDKIGMFAGDNLMVEGAGFLKIETENLPGILASKALAVNDGKLVVNSKSIALLVLGTEANSNGVTIGDTRRILTPQNAKIMTSQTQAFGEQSVSSVVSPSENLLRIEESNPSAITGTNAAKKVVITNKLEQEPLSIHQNGPKTYGDEAFILTTTGGSGEGGLSFESSDAGVVSIIGHTATIKKAGNVIITARKQTDQNYLEALSSTSVSISKRVLHIQADDQLSIAKGSAMPKLTYTVNGLVGADSLTKEPVITTNATDTNVVGEYVISISEAEVLNSESYEISYTNGKLTVTNSSNGDNGNNGNNGNSGNNSGNGSSGGDSSSKDDKDDQEQMKAPVAETPKPPVEGELPQQTTGESSSAASVFTDTENHWAKSDIDFVTKRGLFSGTGDGKFSPDMLMTRGMFVTVLGKLAKVDAANLTSSSFKDVKSDAYYLPYIQWANTAGIVKGVSSDEFAPDMPISREQMAVMLLKYIKAMNIDIAKLREEKLFDDEDEMSTWAKEAVKEIQMMGILSGKPDNTFDPKGSATRAEVSSMLRRFIERTEE
ncbi:S-layer homology domain-containing protein [Anoxynatronum sibiricum]|uniref:S-layer homology domain-containing protein n=1 Tax=Anoxynatronum sibiricum TaxID=210623 RepID=A0ABU9VWT1_9CLOT